nr:hypothetical protein [Pseudomonas sp. PP3]
MNRSTVTALTVAGLLSLGALSVYAGNDAPVDKGGMPPSTEMNAGSGPENALPPGTIEGGNGGDADGSSTSPGAGGGSSAGSGAGGADSGSTNGKTTEDKNGGQ